MSEHRLLITPAEDTVHVSWQRGQAPPRSTQPVPFEHPFESKTLERLRWYLEDYLSFPYGLEPEKAVQVEQQFQHWGQQLFESVFHSSEESRKFFQEATRAGLDRCEIGIVSDNPGLLNLPWELLYAPKEQFLAPKLSGIYRTLSSHSVRAPLPDIPGEQLNILLVIARPYKQDVGFQTIARPMLDALRPLREQGLVSLKVLRPPSFSAFEQELNRHRDGFYHIVHFDGHGTFDPTAQGAQYQLTGETGLGQLVFETAAGEPEVVDADRIAQSLRACRVPVFVLNACKSAQEGGEKFSSVAARFVAAGAQGVVAMAYSVHAEGAKAFIGRFYGELAGGASISEAAAAARISMRNQPQRQSPRGLRTLQDWLVPVLYQQEAYTPLRRQHQPQSFDELMREVEATAVGGSGRESTRESAQQSALPEAGTYGFVGRSHDILRLERAFRRSQVVLIQGMGGVGKTSLSSGFARWLWETQGREDFFFTSFERVATLSNVINDVGSQLGGAKFSALMADKQEAIVLQYLREHPCLLIWDNFEPVNGFPAGNAPLLAEGERERLKGFLKKLRGGQSWVLISSRREEAWLDCGYELVALRGLVRSDAEALAAKILQSVGVERASLPAEYLELLDLLNGHPLSLRVVLPQLRQQTAQALLSALREGLDTFAEADEEGRDKSLVVSLDYSFRSLSAQAQQQLPLLAFFTERVDADWLALFSRSAAEDEAQTYPSVFGGNPDKAQWQTILQEAAAAGILQHLSDTYYQLHPTLPWYLRRLLTARLLTQKIDGVAASPKEVLTELEDQLLQFYAALADHYRRQLVNQAELARFVLSFEEPNFLQSLRLAQQRQQWAEVQSLLQALEELYKRTNRKAEGGPLRQQALQQVGEHLGEVRTKGQEAFDLWMYLKGQDANAALEIADLDGAEAVYQEILNELVALEDSRFESKIAVFYHQLGRVAQARRDYAQAEAFYKKALAIKEQAGDTYSAAYEYQGLGDIAKETESWSDAAQWYQKAIEASLSGNDPRKASDNYSQLAEIHIATESWQDALSACASALNLDLEHTQDKIGYDIYALGQLLQQIGTEEFQRLWQTLTEEPCPAQLFEAIQQANQQVSQQANQQASQQTSQSTTEDTPSA